MPHVSVIIPCYNTESVIASTVKSALAQSVSDVEVVVVDDGSTDGTAAQVQVFGDSVRLVQQSNAGAGAARNTGIRHSTGDIVAFLDADDLWEPDFLASVVPVLDARPDADGVYCHAQYMDADGHPLPGSLRPRPTGDPLAQTLSEGCFILLPMLAIRRTTLERVGLFDAALRQSEDWDLLVRLTAAGARLVCVPRFLVRKRLRPGSLTADIENVLYWSLRTLDKSGAALPAGSRYAMLQVQMRARLFLRAAVNHWRLGASSLAVRRFAEGLEAWPDAAQRPEAFLGIVARLLPPGYRTADAIGEDLASLAGQATALVREVLASEHVEAQAIQRRAVWGSFHAVLAALFARQGAWGHAASHAFRSLSADPRALVALALRSRRTELPSAPLDAEALHPTSNILN